MIPYADTNFFTNLLLELSHSSEAELLTRSNVSILPVTWLLRLEVVNAIQQCVFMSRHGVQDMRLVPEHATVLVSDLGSANGSFINGQRMMPKEVRVLRHGDELRLGKLVLLASFRHP